MSTLPIQNIFTRWEKSSDLQADLRRARWLANWLDSKFSLCGVRFGLDGIVGLVPVVGDTLGVIAGLYPIYVARKHGLGRGVRVRMAGNLLAEWLVGLMPIAGDAADIWFKANLRNCELLEQAARLSPLISGTPEYPDPYAPR